MTGIDHSTSISMYPLEASSLAAKGVEVSIRREEVWVTFNMYCPHSPLEA
jgi:hypothetical protein